MLIKRFKTVTACGTFDRLHAGHKFFLQQAFKRGKHVFIGITNDRFARKKLLGATALPYKKRVETLKVFLKEQGLLGKTTLFPLNDIYGPATSDSPIEAIIVTKKTVGGAREVNQRRKQFGLPALPIVKVPLVKTSGRKAISSQDKRFSELLGKNLTLPNTLRPALKKPLGKLLEGPEDNLLIATRKAKDVIEKENPLFVATVGDVVTKSFNELAIPINLAVIDFKIRREKKVKNLKELGFNKEVPDLTIDNPPGTITSSLSSGINKALKKITNQPRTYSPETIIIKVLGEEDLSVLPVIILSPVNWVVCYGQPEKGIVYIKVNGEVKSRTLQLLSQFEDKK